MYPLGARRVLEGLGAPGGLARTSSLLTDLVAYYALDNNGNDELGAHNLSDYGTPSYGTGKIGTNAYQATGSDPSTNYLYHADDAHFDFQSDPFTISCWFYAAASGTGPLVAKWSFSDGARSYALTYNYASDGYVSFFITGDGALGAEYSLITLAIPTAEVWHHVVAWWDGNGIGKKKIYLMLDNNYAGAATASHDSGAYDSATAFTIGSWDGANSPADEISIDELGIWRRELTTTEMGWLYASGSGLTYPF